MEKFLLILRENGISCNEHSPEDWHTVMPALMEWIHSLSKSGNYCSGESIANTGKYVTRDKMINSKSIEDANERILRFDVIKAEHINLAVSIAQTCPLVKQGFAVIEVRTILALTR
jgi:hypothetical protein